MSTTTPAAGARRRRLLAGVGVGALAAVDLAIKAWAPAGLVQPVDLGLLQLRLAYNSGMAFSLGDNLPSWAILTLTGLIAAGIAIGAWRTAKTGTPALTAGLTVVLAGAVANLIDRAADGRVTDYLHTGWWPTFNLADTFITIGAAAIIYATLRAPARQLATRSGDSADAATSGDQS